MTREKAKKYLDYIPHFDGDKFVDEIYDDFESHTCKNRAREDRIKFLEKQNRELMEHIVYLKKDGYRYDQLTTKMRLCDKCGNEFKTVSTDT